MASDPEQSGATHPAPGTTDAPAAPPRAGSAGRLARVLARVGRRLLQPGRLFANLGSLAREVKRGGVAGGMFYLRQRLVGLSDNSIPDALYRTWVQRVDTLTDADRAAVRRHIEGTAHKPLVSVVVPVYNTAEPLLRAMIGSVQAQLYPHWELCIADDASPSPHVARVLGEYAAADPRIRWMRRETNGHICAASNSALALARGEFVALLDHDDILPEHALYAVVAALNDDPDLDLIYSDEDKLDENGERYSPYFKPAFSYDQLLGQNVISHFGVYRRSAIAAVGGFREGFEGGQDYDLALRIVEHSGEARVRHIPAVLYHWRQERSGGSFSQSRLEQCIAAASRAVQEALDGAAAAGRNDGRRAVVETNPLAPIWNRVRWDVPQPAPLVSVIIPTRDRAGLLETCLDGLLSRTSYSNIEVLIVDNGSVEQATHDLLARYREDARVRVLRIDGEFNYSALNNAAAGEARGDILLLLNNDIDVIGPDWLSEMVSLVTRDGVGVVGAKLLYADGRVQHAGVRIGAGTFEDGPGVAGHFGLLRGRNDPGYFGQFALTRDVSAVTGACLAIRRSVYREVGGLDADNLKVAFNDVDLCLRVRAAGYRVLWTPFAELFHLESVSRGQDTTPEKRERFAREVRWMFSRWGETLADDPFCNIDLDSRWWEDRKPALPPRQPAIEP